MKLIFAHMYNTDKLDWQGKILAGLIKWWTKSKYFHTEIIFNGYWYTADVYSGGVIKRRLRPFKNTFDYTYLEVPENKVKDIEIFLDSMLDKNYDLETILINKVLHIPYNNKNKVYCTELALDVLHEIGELKEIKDNGTIDPGSFYNITKEKYTEVTGTQLNEMRIY